MTRENTRLIQQIMKLPQIQRLDEAGYFELAAELMRDIGHDDVADSIDGAYPGYEPDTRETDIPHREM